MKYSTLFFGFAIALFTACAPINYYQLNEAKAIGNTENENFVFFEDENCRVSYDLWSKGGDAGFTIYNRSDSYVTLDLTKSFFVVNGEAYDYFLNRTYFVTSGSIVSTSSATAMPYYWSIGATGAGISSASSSSSSILEKDTRTLPPSTYIKISQFSVTDYLYSDCDFVKYPSNNKVSSVSFEQSESPYQFYNLINYTIADSISVEMKNEFNIAKISNYPENIFVSYYKKNKCNEEYFNPQPYFTFSGKEKSLIKDDKFDNQTFPFLTPIPYLTLN